MFGYVRPRVKTLRVGENEYYKATYCGLCRTVKKNASRLSSMILNYDFVFLALWRMMQSEEKSTGAMCRCPVHPLKKRPMICCSNSLAYTGDAMLILSYHKLLDDIKDPDKSFFKKLMYRIYTPFLSRDIKKRTKAVPTLSVLSEEVERILTELSAIENNRSSSIDAAAEKSGELLSLIASFGLEGKKASLSKELGDALGKFIYILDACDDLKSDEKSGSYNPLLLRYGSVNDVVSHFRDIDQSLSDYIYKMAQTFDLADIGLISPIIENTIKEGMPDAARKVFLKYEKEFSEKAEFPKERK